MVILHVKKAEKSLFLFETACSSQVSDVTSAVAEIYNAILKVERLAEALEGYVGKLTNQLCGAHCNQLV